MEPDYAMRKYSVQTAAMKTVTTIAELRGEVRAWRGKGDSVVLVPTMGALHEGHLSLVRLAGETGERTVVSIFLNPAQFAASEDFDSYPRDYDTDVEKLARLGVDLVFMPPVEEIYPEGFSTRVSVERLSEGLCGASRPHFFGGVATVVAKLLNQCRPDVAIFGEKDYQQLLVIARMARDLDLDVEIVGAPIVREPDGLAMSSRNAYLSADERAQAPLLYRTIAEAAEALGRGGAPAEVLDAARGKLTQGGFEIDYLEVREAGTLAPVTCSVSTPARVFAAAMLGRTRLIDNVAVPERKPG
jgi:pantoate--beta-alanine ligase